MRRFFNAFLCFAFPWIVFLMKDNPGAALMALIMQATVIGWIPASTWAFRTLEEDRKKAPSEKKS